MSRPDSPRRDWRRPNWFDSTALVVGLVLLGYVLTRVPLADIAHACQRVGPLVLITPLIALGWNVCNTSALHVLLEGRVPWRDLLWNRLVGDGYNSVLPLAGLGGEPWKLRHLTQFIATDRAIAALIRDRILENAVGLLVSSAAIATTTARFEIGPALRTALYGYVVFAAVAGLAGAALVATRLPGRIGQRLGRWLGGTSAPLPDALPPGRFVRSALWCLAGRIVGFIEIGALLWMLGLGVHVDQILWLDSVLNAAGFIGFAIPQGIGVFEGASVYLFGVLGAPAGLAVAFALARRGRMLLVSLAGVGMHLVSRLGGRSRPVPTAIWEAQYKNGHWDYLDSAAQVPHYAVIVGYVQHLNPKPRVLDVGCGHGRLFQLISPFPLTSYLGTDVSTEAIAKAQTLATVGARFEAACFEDAVPDERFDVVIFNESLYYSQRPAEVLRRYASVLDENGRVVISMCSRRRNHAIWRAIGVSFRTLHATRVVNEQGESWDVKVLCPA